MEDVSYPFFRATQFESSPGLVEVWLRHFEEIEIPAALVEVKGDHGVKFSVWRWGVECLEREPNREALAGLVVRDCHGFENNYGLYMASMGK